MLQVGGKNSPGFFREVECVEGAVDFGLVAALGMVFEADADGLAVGGHSLEGKMPELRLGQARAQFGFFGNRDAGFLQGIKELLK